MDEYLEFAKEIADYAGKIMKEYFYSNQKNTTYKSDRTPVTIADEKINQYLIKKVKEKYPTHSVLGEEASNKQQSKYAWVCDPLDGTASFVRGVPIAVFSLALVIDGNPEIGVVYDPFLDNMYTAIKGQGAYCNNKEIHVNNIDYKELGCSIDCYMWHSAKYDTLEIIRDIRAGAKTFETGSVAHGSMLVASGKISAVIFPGSEHANCDLAASKLIVEEAGGKVTDLFGKNQRFDQDLNGAILSNGIIHEKLVSVAKKVL